GGHRRTLARTGRPGPRAPGHQRGPARTRRPNEAGRRRSAGHEGQGSRGGAAMTTVGVVLLTTFLASTVEAIEMVVIVLGVGATRGWRSTLVGAGAGFAVLAPVIAVLGAALTAIPIGPLRVLVGTLLLLFGLQWFRKGIARVAANGLAGYQGNDPDEAPPPQQGTDGVAFVLTFKGVLLEGLEVAFIVVSFGA